jgi:hypothetical protein
MRVTRTRPPFGEVLHSRRSGRPDAAATPTGGYRCGSPEYRSSSSDLAAGPATTQEPRQPGGGQLLVVESTGAEKAKWWEPDRALPGHMSASEARVPGRAFCAEQVDRARRRDARRARKAGPFVAAAPHRKQAWRSGRLQTACRVGLSFGRSRGRTRRGRSWLPSFQGALAPPRSGSRARRRR